MTEVNHRSIEELSKTIEELEVLTTKPTLSARDEKRHAWLLSKVSMLKAGISVGELRRFEEERLRSISGLPRLPERARTKLGEDIEQEWRSAISGNPIRETNIPPRWVFENRAFSGELAGKQSVSLTEGAPGGYFVPTGFAKRLQESMKQADDIFQDWASNVVETDSGAAMPFPVLDDVATDAIQVGETSQSVEAEIANVGSSTLRSYAFRSQLVVFSIELFQDVAWPAGEIIERVFARRMARGVGKAMILGSGVNQPTGLLTATVGSGASPVIASGSASNTGGSETGATSVGSQDVGKVLAALNPAYRRNAVWAMNDSTLMYLSELIDKSGRPLMSLRKSLDDPEDGPVLLGRRVAICPHMPNMGSTANSIVCYDPSYLIQRRVPAASYVRIFRETPGLVEAGLLAFEAWTRFDSALLSPNASYPPCSYLQMHS